MSKKKICRERFNAKKNLVKRKLGTKKHCPKINIKKIWAIKFWDPKKFWVRKMLTTKNFE